MTTTTLTHDEQGRPIPQSFIHMWNGTTSAEIENEKLKKQVDALIENLNATAVKNDELEEIKKLLKPITKALNHKIKDVEKVNAKDDLIAKFRAKQMLKNN